MDAAAYRARAEHLLTRPEGYSTVPLADVQEARIWALLAISAAQSETTRPQPTPTTTNV